jgi:hypothetical protein
MRRLFRQWLTAFLSVALIAPAWAQAPAAAAAPASTGASAGQLDQLLAPIALYPDALLS